MTQRSDYGRLPRRRVRRSSHPRTGEAWLPRRQRRAPEVWPALTGLQSRECATEMSVATDKSASGHIALLAQSAQPRPYRRQNIVERGYPSQYLPLRQNYLPFVDPWRMVWSR
jgi:hypothetical protein